MSTVSKMLFLASGVVVWAATETSAAEYQCRKQDSALRIAVEVKKTGHTLPCEVVAEDDRGERAVLYSAQYDRDYCPSRIEKTRIDLEQDGWRCELTSAENVASDRTATIGADTASHQASVQVQSESGSGGALVTDDGQTILASHQCRQGDDLRRIRIEADDPDLGKPCELIYWADGDQTKPGELLWRAQHDAAFCPRRLSIIVDKWVREGWSCDPDEIQTVVARTDGGVESEPELAEEDALSTNMAEAEVAGEADRLEADPALQAIVSADAERIGEWMEVDPAIEIAARGDLNDDGSEDAVVFLAYQSDQAAYRQYLMSYLVAEDGYQLASVKLLTGVNPPPAQARVEEIDKGVIWLTLPDGDSSTPEQTGYRLRNQQLVEVDPKTPFEVND